MLGRRYSKFYNTAALFLTEIPGMVTPRLFDAVGNNMSFRFANTAVSHLELRLKDLHRKYGASIWDRYNDPDSLAKDRTKWTRLHLSTHLGVSLFSIQMNLNWASSRTCSCMEGWTSHRGIKVL